VRLNLTRQHSSLATAVNINVNQIRRTGRSQHPSQRQILNLNMDIVALTINNGRNKSIPPQLFRLFSHDCALFRSHTDSFSHF
jgi:hypothetical protein